MYFSVLICIAVESSVSPGNMDVILILPAGDEDRHGQEVLEVVNFYQRLLIVFFSGISRFGAGSFRKKILCS